MAQAWVAILLFLCLLLPANAGTAALSERTYKRLTVIHELMAEGKYSDARKRLDALSPRVKGNNYEYAVIMQTYGFLYAAKDQYKKAATAFNEALSLDVLPDQVQLSMRYNLAQLYAAVSEYKAAAKAYEQWFAIAKAPSADSFVFAAGIYVELKNYRKAIKKIKAAIRIAPAPKESWYQLLVAMYYQQKQYSKAADVLQSMLALWPDKDKYWEQLSSVYFALNQPRKALVVRELANKRGFLTEEKELLALVNLYLYEKIPYKGAALLEKEIKSGRIAGTGENLQLLGESWMRAKENDKALHYLAKAAQKRKEGKLFLQLAQLYADKEDWSSVIRFADKALGAGDLAAPGKAQLLRGMAYFEQGKVQLAMQSFRRGSKYPDSKAQAIQWINYINDEYDTDS